MQSSRRWIGIVVAAFASLPGAAQDATWREGFRLAHRPIVGMNFSPDGAHLAASGRDFITIYDTSEPKILKNLQQHDLVDEAVYRPTGGLLCTRSSAEDVVLHDAPEYTRLSFAMDTAARSVPRTHKCPAAFSPGGTWIVLSNGLTGVRFWNLSGLTQKRKHITETGVTEMPIGRGEYVMLPHVNAFAFYDENLWLGFDEGYVYPLYFDTGETKGRTPPPIRKDDIGHPGGRVYRTPEKVRMFRPHKKAVSSLVFIEEKLVTAGWEGEVHFWNDITKLTELHDPRNNEARPKKPPQPDKTIPGYYVSLSPDGETLAVAEAWKVKLYDAMTLEPVGVLEGSPALGRPVRIRFNPKKPQIAVTYCCCTECIDDHVIRLTSSPPRRVHQHGGVLVAWEKS